MSEKLLEIKDLLIEADIDGQWKPIVNSLSMTLERGEIVGLIGESGAGKSTFGLTALGYTKPGCRIVSGSIKLDGAELVGKSDAELRKIRGNRVAYVAQSAAASFNPAHTLVEQFLAHCHIFLMIVSQAAGLVHPTVDQQVDADRQRGDARRGH